MAFQFLTAEAREQKMLSWTSVGLLIFLSAFLWAPSRDGLQGVYVLAFFLPMLIVLLFRKPNFNEYGGWPTITALTYAGFSVLSTLWGEPKDFVFFMLQWCVLATWLCGSCLVFSKRDIDTEKYLRWCVLFGALIAATTILYYCYSVFFYGFPSYDRRLWGWNVFRNPNEIGAMCGIIVLLAITIAFQSSNLKRVWLFYGVALVPVIGLVMSFSRGALLACIVTVFAALIIIRPALKIWLPPILIIAFTIVIILSMTNLDAYYLDGRIAGLSGRLPLWQAIFDKPDKNIFIGIGIAKNSTIIISDTEFNHAHNAWLDIFYRTGLIGLFLVLLHLKTVMQKFSRDSRLLPLYLWLCYGCICNLFDGRSFFWDMGAKWFLYWIPVGLIVASYTGINIRKLTSTVKK